MFTRLSLCKVLVVPATQMVDYVLKGHDFSGAENGRK